jgi:polyisoprenoid-binding protein YceI
MKHILLLSAVVGCWIASPAHSLTPIKKESTVTYHLVHPLHKIEATSSDVNYALDADESTKTVRTVTAEVDVSTFDSGNSNRDSHAMEVIDAIDFPTAEFRSSGVEQNGDSIRVSGVLTFHGVSQRVIIPGKLQWTDHKLVMQGDFDVSLDAFKIERPSLLMIPVEDAMHFSILAAFGW